MRARREQLLRTYLPFESKGVQGAAELLLSGARIGQEEGQVLFDAASLGVLSLLATWVRLGRNGDRAYYNRTRHIEPTNVCIYRCKFCSYRGDAGAPGSWRLGLDEIRRQAELALREGVSELHITGGAYPGWGVADLAEIVRLVRLSAPGVHLKAFSAVEIVAACRHDGVSFTEGLRCLQEAGLSSIPGGGAEIFASRVRREICPEKCSGEEWLSLHRAWHALGGKSNATMLFGHVERRSDRVDHLERLRRLQDETMGFNSFIPLKFRSRGNGLGRIGEVPLVEVLRTYAVSVLYLDNFPHIKAYWPMLGKDNLEFSLSFGADDLDGTIDDTTKIYSMAGAEEQRPRATVEEFEELVARVGYCALERDSDYREVG